MRAPNKFWGNMALANKLTIFVSLLILFVVTISTVVAIRQARKNFREGLENQAHLLLETLPLTMRDPLYRLEIDEILDTASVVSGNQAITTFVVYNREGIVLVDAVDDGAAFSQVVDPLGAQLVSSAPDEIWLNWGTGAELIAGRPIYLGNEPLGAVVIGLSTDALQIQINRITSQNIIFAVLVLSIAAGLAYLFSLEITTPLSNLRNVALKMAEGDLGNRIGVQFDDEVGQLSGVFNHMAEAIQQRENELREFAAGLEQAVEERTVELSETNLNLLDEIARRKASEDALILARNEALAATKMKTQLLANVSHDLRTPLNVILGYGEILNSGRFGEFEGKSKEMLGEIINSSGQLLGFVNNLLDQAQIEAGRIQINYQPFSPQVFLDSLLSLAAVLANAKGIPLVHEIDEDVPDMIEGDFHWLHQAVYNLLANAIKFTEEGEVRVRIHLLDKSNWAISVIDTGIGIPEEVQRHIFDPFWQVDGTPTRGHMGSGLGLSIVKQLIDRMAGDVRLVSAFEKGSTFTIILPLQPAKEKEV